MPVFLVEFCMHTVRSRWFKCADPVGCFSDFLITCMPGEPFMSTSVTCEKSNDIMDHYFQIIFKSLAEFLRENLHHNMNLAS